eukprot:TRINITY_DN10853_c0_g1_i1.p2 TRINITY_DN10853_c0_g1~~TRINITY_DN10853_c0_g1_i1.p2  ORF type:complete len:121 (-),score=33.58 TRINITY_DN10853_c0_g1_i1:118-480(-)
METYSEMLYDNWLRGAGGDQKTIKAQGVNLQCDVFSFGALVLELLLGKLPARDLCQLAVRLGEKSLLMKAVDQVAGDWPEEVAEALRRVAAACLQGSREARPDMMTVHAQVLRILSLIHI